MGPRRKLSLAITEVRKQREDVEGEGGGGQREVAEKERHSESDDRESADSGRVERQSSRPQLMKQPSTELTAAYRHVRKSLEGGEGAKERKKERTGKGGEGEGRGRRVGEWERGRGRGERERMGKRDRIKCE